MHSLVDAVTLAYGSLEQPSFAFAEREYERAPYARLLSLLRSSGLTVEDVTDLNDDVAVHVTIRKGPGTEFSLWLSLVGRYGILVAASADKKSVRVIAPDTDVTKEALAVVALCAKENVLLLDQSVAEVPIALHIPNADPSTVRMFQALFSDRQTLPWEPGNDATSA